MPCQGEEGLYGEGGGGEKGREGGDGRGGCGVECLVRARGFVCREEVGRARWGEEDGLRC